MLNNTGWSYASGAGVGGTVGECLEVTAGYARIYVTSPNSDTFAIDAAGVGVGIGLGLLPAAIAGSLPDFVSAGSNIYTIYNDPISLSNLTNVWLIYQGNLTALTGSGYGALVLFIDTSWPALLACISNAFALSVLLARCIKGFCLVTGAQMSTPNLSADATGTFYMVGGSTPQ